MDEKTLGRRIKERRMELGLSQIELAKAVGLIQAKISQIELGERRIDLLKELPLFVKALGKPIEWFIEGDECEEADKITLESVLREKCPSLKIDAENIEYLKDLVGDVITPILERDERFSKETKKSS